MSLFFLVLARDEKYVDKKIDELTRLAMPYLIVCGKKLNRPNVVYREPKGKSDAINFGLRFVPSKTDIVVLNDVDTEVHNFDAALSLLRDDSISLVFVKVEVKYGPQRAFYSFLDALRGRFPIAASGELMLVRHSYLKKILPLRECKAEDSYILFKVLEIGGKTVFCRECYVTTERTTYVEQEETYKRRTVGGIYQALSLTRPPLVVRFFYMLLPFVSPMLIILGRKGYYWTKGILLGFLDCSRGDRAASWTPINA